MRKPTLFRRTLAIALSVAIVNPAPLLAQTDISSQPLAQPAANVKPNILLLHDDSGSMRQQYTPDFIGRYFGGSNAQCYDSADGGSIGTTLENCEAGDPPLMAPEFNTQYYNPEIRYFPAVNYDGTSKISMTAANTTNWTAVPTDGVSSNTTFRKTTLDMHGSGSTTTTANLVTGYPDRAWCTAQADDHTNAANFPTLCRLNSNYTYPNLNYGFGLNSDSTVKYIFGAPYYYRLQTTEYCTDTNMTSCIASTTPTATHTVPAPVRWCDSTALTNCQAKRQGSFTRPKFTGTVVGAGGSNPAASATGTITVKNPQSDAFTGTITGITVGATQLIATTVTGTGPMVANTVATSIKNEINNNTAAGLTHGYVASCTGGATCTSNVVTITAPAVGTLYNGLAVAVASTGTPLTRATASFNTDDADNNDTVNGLTVGPTQLLSSSITCNTSTWCTGNQASRDALMAQAVVDMINANTSASLAHGFTATRSGETVTVTAPVGSGSEYNGLAVTLSESGITNVTGVTMSGGTTNGDIETTVTNFTGGGDANEGRTNTGTWVRTNIVSGQTYPKFSARTDCVGASCTYDEEMTNFANWYSYYRSRGQMAKTALGRAFVGISDAFRVGFMTINVTSSSLGTRFLAVNDFSTASGGQKDLWYQRLYATSDNGSTPLREALSRAGRYYAGVTGGINPTGMSPSPIQVACQPSYTILVTDGYWNGNQGVDLSGSAVGNQDNVDSGYSKRSEPGVAPGGGRYDGGLSGSTNTLADVAMYYYKTDLRTDLSDQVPVTSRDPASHQHMTTFTVGLGLAGRLTFDKGYENGTSPDFERLKIAPASGGLDWPVPAADSETALDDLWHAAVNGRGTFFSAKDPAELATSITETLSSVQARVGAGAAAATSNLQPVAGDNFAFTAQYETVTWIGDIKARTIDLSTGVVASRELWSAAALLDARASEGRSIYTFHAADDTAPATGNGNKLKHFCYPAAMGTAAYPGCTDGPGLADPSEMDYFLTQATSPAPGNEPRLAQSTPWATDLSGRNLSATRESLVDYLRGQTVNEDTGSSTPTASDLYRARVSRLGDIINAQPAYVKGSPFSYNSGAFVGTDPFYTEFKNTTNGVSGTRKGTVYVAANDGMLHALETDPDNQPYYQTGGIGTITVSDDTFTGTLNTSATSGEGSERWAYIPGIVVPYLKRLADNPYTHRYYTDGTPIVGDVCFDHTTATPCSAQNKWRTILVAGLNAGGRGYYALDVTDPDNPKALWEVKGGTGTTCLTAAQADGGTFSEDCNIGLSFGNPLIVKRKSDGKWVVIFTSGYNNVSPGDGKGYLYMVDAQTGKILKRLTTGVGCDGVSTTSPCVAGTVDPSGLGKINAWVDNAAFDNTALTVYGGDLKGNVWRFELDGTAFPTVTQYSVTRLATVVDPSGVAQSITVKPELGKVNSSERAVFIGTGRFLGTTDKSSIQRQSFYAIRDQMNSITSPVFNMARSGSYPTQTISGFTRQTLIPSTTNPLTQRTTAVNTDVPFQSPTQNGWFIDFPDGGTSGSPSERVNVDPILQLGTLVVPSNVPNSDTCVAGGYGWINFLDYKTGTYIVGSTNNTVSQKISSSLVVGINVVQLPGGTVKTIVTTADNQQLTEATPVGATAVTGRRVSWRELFFE